MAKGEVEYFKTASGLSGNSSIEDTKKTYYAASGGELAFYRAANGVASGSLADNRLTYLRAQTGKTGSLADLQNFLYNNAVAPTFPLMAFTAPANTPVITDYGMGASVASTIDATALTYREKRTAAVEAVGSRTPSTVQVDASVLDLVGSTHFYYSNVSSNTFGVAANPGQYVQTDFKPGSTAALQNALWLFNVETLTEAPVVEFRFRAPVTNFSFGMVLVDGLRVQESAYSTVSTAGSGWAVRLTFPGPSAVGTPRRIQVLGAGNVGGNFGGMACSSGYSLVKPARTITKRVAFIGDSFSNGAGAYPTGTGGTETFIWDLARMMGADETIQAGIGSTGFNAILTGQPTSNFAGRISQVMAWNPTHVIFVGGRNDTAATLTADVQACLDAVGAGVYRAVISSASQSTGSAQLSAMQAAVASRAGVRMIATDVDALPKLGDAIHPTFAGHKTLAVNSYALL